MKNQFTRRNVLKNMAGGAAVLTSAMLLPGPLQAAAEPKEKKLKDNIKHSVCKWTFKDMPLEELCKAAKGLGLSSIELLGPEEWPTLKKYGLTCAMAWGAEKGLTEGFNEPKYHDELVARYEAMIPKVANAGLNNLICFSGNRNGMSDEQGMENCAKGLKRLMKAAEKHNVTLSMELLNSKIDHKGYMCDHTKWGVDLAKMIGSDQFKLLYDIYHMQIMEGDVIRTIKEYHPYISHYHTAGVPGRHEIDNSQELYYPAIMRAIADTGFKGFVGQEFIPTAKDPLASLRESIMICDV